MQIAHPYQAAVPLQQRSGAAARAQDDAASAHHAAHAILQERVREPEEALRRAQAEYDSAVRKAHEDPAYRAARRASRAADIKAQHNALKVQKSLNDVQAALNDYDDGSIGDEQYYGAMQQVHTGVGHSVLRRMAGKAPDARAQRHE